MQSKLFFFILCFFSLQLTAQDTLSIKEIQVTASKIPLKTYETGRSVKVLTNEEIQALPISTVDELLRYVSGMNINTRNGFGVQADIGMRGSTFSQVLVVVDNVRFNDPLTAHFNHNIPVALAEIQQIEITKGPAGASYGSDAVGGMIHIKTKAYTEQTRKNEIKASGNLGYGENQLIQTDLGVMAHLDRWLISASAKTNISDGEELVNPNFAAGIATDSLYNNFFNIQSYSGSVSYFVNDRMKINARGGYDFRDFAAKYFYTRSAYDESTEQTKNTWGQLALSNQGDHSDWEINIGHKIVEDFFEFNPLFSANTHQTTQTFANFLHNIRLNDDRKIAYGLQFLNKTIESNDRGNHDNSSFAAYGILHQKLADNINTNFSLRLEYDQNFGLEYLPQASISYLGNGYVLRASYGRAVRAADFTERYVSSQIPDLAPGRNIGNPDLKAEKSNSFDIGADWNANKNISLSGSAFFRTSKNLIDFTTRNADDITNVTNLQAGEDYFYADNISEANTFGIELDLTERFRINDQSNIELILGYTYLQTNVESTLLSKYIANHPKHNVAASLTASLYGLNITAMANYIQRDAEFLESINGDIKDQYFTTNLKLSYSILPQLSVYGNIINLTDTDYQEILGAQPAGRWMSGGLQFDF